jgi:hypothetical protein
MSANVVVPNSLGTAAAVIHRPDGRNRRYPATADTAAARGTALLAARAAAVSGETIHVSPGDFTVTSTLAKDGVKWHFDLGAVVTMTSGYIWDTAGAAMTFRVSGHGYFISTPPMTDIANYNSGIIRCNNAAAVVDIEHGGLEFNLSPAAAGGPGGEQGTYYAGVRCQAGTLSVRGPTSTLNATDISVLDWFAMYWWDNGAFEVTCPEIVGNWITTNAVEEASCFAVLVASNVSPGATPTGHFHLNSNNIEWKTTSAVVPTVISGIGMDGLTAMWSTGNAKGVSWVETEKAIGNVLVNGGKFYLGTQKLENGMLKVTGGKMWLTKPTKIGGDLPFASPYVVLGGGYSNLPIHHFDPTSASFAVAAGTAATNVQELVLCSGGTHLLKSADITGASTFDCVKVTGGTLNLFSGIPTASGGGKELNCTGGTLRVFPDVHYTEANTSGVTKANLFGAAYSTGGAGTVTSVGLNLPTSTFATSGTPVTGAGVIVATFNTQTANTYLAGPTTGSAAAPTWRAAVAADINGLSPTFAGVTATGSFVMSGAGTMSGTVNATGVMTVSNTNSSWSGSVSLSNVSGYLTGTAYTVGTAANGIVAGGTTSPTVTIPATGTYRIEAGVNFTRAAVVTSGGDYIVTTKVRKTSGTPADVANTSVSYTDDFPLQINLLGGGGVDGTYQVICNTATFAGTVGDVLSISAVRNSIDSGTLTIGKAYLMATRIG